MSDDSVERIRSVMAAILEPRLLSQGMTITQLQDGVDLRDEGLVDSLGFVQLLTELETRLERHIDLTELDPESLTNVGALARHIAAGRRERSRKRRRGCRGRRSSCRR